MGKIIGIVGGVGPYAGLDLNTKIFDNAPAKKDQDFPNVILISFSEIIGDRTMYVLNPEKHENPAFSIAEVVATLAGAGAEYIGIPCNTAHCRPIFSKVEEIIAEKGLKVVLVNMIEETVSHILENYPRIKKVGLLSTLGTRAFGLYNEVAEKQGLELITPSQENAEAVHRAIYDAEFGIKAHSNPVHPKATAIFEENAVKLFNEGAEAVIMGCTEIPLGLTSTKLKGIFIDPASILARKLLEKAGYQVKLST